MNHLRDFFRVHAPQAEMMLTLQAPFEVGALNVGVTLTRDVTARVAPLGTDDRAYTIAWAAVAAGPFPAFAGTIFTDRDPADSERAIVTLDGHYHPPLGFAGNVFDALIGGRIATASATNLLERVCAFARTGVSTVPALA